jgi:hypothetical protein
MAKTKFIEMTGSPKTACFKTKAVFLAALAPFGFEQDRMRKRSNKVSILVTNDVDSTTNKMKLAEELGVEVLTYSALAELFDLN